jgi:hypothetical protein
LHHALPPPTVWGDERLAWGKIRWPKQRRAVYPLFFYVIPIAFASRKQRFFFISFEITVRVQDARFCADRCYVEQLRFDQATVLVREFLEEFVRLTLARFCFFICDRSLLLLSVAVLCEVVLSSLE